MELITVENSCSFNAIMWQWMAILETPRTCVQFDCIPEMQNTSADQKFNNYNLIYQNIHILYSIF